MTFCKRKVGLLKKASEIATLCGVEVSLIFTDMTGNVHFFTNNDVFKFTINERKKVELANQNLFKYNPMQYPFIGEGDNTKKIKVESQEERESLLMKRNDREAGIYHSELEPPFVQGKQRQDFVFPPRMGLELVIFFPNNQSVGQKAE